MIIYSHLSSPVLKWPTLYTSLSKNSTKSFCTLSTSCKTTKNKWQSLSVWWKNLSPSFELWRVKINIYLCWIIYRHATFTLFCCFPFWIFISCTNFFQSTQTLRKDEDGIIRLEFECKKRMTCHLRKSCDSLLADKVIVAGNG